MPKFVPLAQADQEDAAASGEGAPRFVPLAEADHLPDDAPAAQKPLPEDVTPSEGRGRGFTDPRLVGKLPTPQGAPSVSDMELTPVSSTDPNAAGGFTASRDTSGSVLDDQGGGDVSNLRASRRQNVLDDALGPHTLKPESQTRGELMARNRSLEAGESFGDALSDPVSRGVVKAVTGGAQSMAGTVRAVADQAARFDVPGARQVGEFARGAGQGATDFETGMGEASGPKDTTFGPNSPVPYLARMGEGAVSSLAQSAQLATVMGPRAVIPMMALQQAGQQYQQAREQGLSPDLALANAIPSGAFEAIGEKFSGLDKAAGAMRTLLARGATQQAKIDAGHTLVEFGFKELPGELITTVGQDAIDKMPGIGLKQNMTMEDFINDLRDTAVQTAMMSGVTIGAGHGVASHAAGQPQMSAEALARSKGFLALDEQAKRMKAAGETELAATIQKQADTGRAADELETLKDRPWADDPTFGERYTALRADGKKPAEAAARAGMAAAYEHLANGLGVAEEVWKKGVDAAAKLPMEKVPAFFEAFTAALVKKGASQPAPEGTVHGTVQGVRDDAIATTIHGVYGEDTPAETMDAITKLERREQHDQPATKGAETVAAPLGSGQDDQAVVEGEDKPLKLLTPNEAGAHLAHSSPLNDTEATKAQILAGNAPLGHMSVGGLGYSVENTVGSVRSDLKNEPPKWQTPMEHGYHYGYFKRTEGNDGDHVDAFVKEGTPEDYAGPVFVVDQVKPGTRVLDEHKVMVGPTSAAEALQAYNAHYQPGWKGADGVTEMSWPDFKRWVRDGVKTDRLSTPGALAGTSQQGTTADSGGSPAVPGVGGATAPGAAAAPADGGAGAVGKVETATAKAAPLRLGITPNDADAVTVKDGVVHIGKSEALHYETGEPVTVPAGAGDAAIRQALKDAGAVSRRQKFFGGAKEAPVAVPAPEPEKINTPAPAPRPVLPPDALARRKPARVALPQTSPKGEPVHAHGFIAAEGGLRKSEMADTGFDRNLRVGNRWLFAGDGKGLSIEQATEKLVEAGYLKPGAGHNEAYDLIRKSATHAPQYTPEGWEQLGEAGHKARFEEQLEAVSAKSDPLADIEDAPDELSKEDMQVQREFAALVATAEAQGIDTDSILEEAFYLTQNGPLHEYHAEVSRRLDAERARLAAGAGAGSGQAAQGAGDEPGRHAAEQPGQRAGDQVPGAASGQETASDAHTVGARVTRESALLDGSTIRDDKGTEYRVHYQRNALVIAHPIVNGKPQVSSTTSVRFWTDPSQPSASENDRTDPIYVVAQPTAKPVLPPDALAKPRDLLGEAPNASQQAAAAAKAALEEKQRKQQQAAPEAGELTLTGSDRPADVAAAHGQGDLLGGLSADDSRRGTEQLKALREKLRGVEDRITSTAGMGRDFIEDALRSRKVPKELKDQREALRQQVRELSAELEGHGIADKSKPILPPDALAKNKQPDVIDDFGEKIGGARKDTALPGGTRGRKREADDRPTWAKRFEISQIVAAPGQVAGDKKDEGRWIIRDSRSLDWMKQPRQVGRTTFATKEEAEAFLPMAAVAMKHRVVATSGGKYEIWRDVSDRKRVKVVDQQFDSHEAAKQYLAQHATQILETNTTFGEADLPLPPDKRREGAPRRKGDVKGQDFMDAFGLRGVEFGNWNNQQERQALMNDAYDGLMDLADVLGVPPKALSLNGDLALAFGARGHGLSGARAHYELDRAVINLTKETGAGSLAHEWFHALDHYLGRQDGKASAEWVTDKDGTRTLKVREPEQDMASGGFGRQSQVREELRKAYEAVMLTMAKKATQYVEDTAKADNFTARAREDLTQQLDQLRRDLSTAQTWKSRNNKPASAEQLTEFDTIAQRLLEGEAQAVATDWRSVETAANRIAHRWTNDNIEQLGAIFKAVRGRQGFDSANQSGPLDRVAQATRRYSERLKMLADAQSGTEKVKMVPTDFAMNAKELDQGRGGDYWTTPHEMAARAFQGYVDDKIAEQGNVSRFLNYAPQNAGILTPWGVKFPYPRGAERTAINKALQAFVDTIQTKETDKGTAMFARGPVWKSELESAIAGAAMKQAPAAGWSEFIAGLGKKGVKPDEIEWSGIRDWLAMQPGKVSKEAVLDYLKGNGVQVQEVHKGASETGDAVTKLREERDAVNVRLTALGFEMREEHGEPILRKRVNGMDFTWEDGQFRDEDGEPLADTDKEARDLAIQYGALTDQIESFGGQPEDQGDTRYGNYTLPGGQNYREVLLTLPTTPTQAGLDKRKAIFDRYQPLIDQAIAHTDSLVGKDRGAYDRAFAEHSALMDKRNAEADAAYPLPADKPYRSSHWNEPNILAHIRLNDRTDADGKRVLFVEELQSDWAQAGRKRGFENKAQVAAKIAAEGGVDAIKAKTEQLEQDFERRTGQPAFVNGRGDNFTGPEADEWNRLTGLLEELHDSKSDRQVPRAPFVEKTDAWLALALKRVIKLAADEGYDRVAFVNGQQSADRYDLSKQVDSVMVWGDAKDGYYFEAKKNGRNAVADKGKPLTEAQLADYIGKDLAAKAVQDIAAGKTAEYSGEGLRVGGGGMIAFYDKVVPLALNKLLPKLGGGKVGEVSITGVKPEYSIKQVPVGWAVQSRLGSVAFKTRKEADAYVAEHFDAPKMQPGFDVTPAMREKAAEGMPLFRAGDKQADAAPQPATPKRVAELQQQVDAITAKWDKAPPVTVVASAQSPAVPQAIRDAEQAARDNGGGVGRAVFYKGEVWIFADGVRTDTELATYLYHEVLGHAGLRGHYGRELNNLLDQVAMYRRADVTRMIERTGMTGPRVQQRAAEEVLAYLAQTKPDLPLVKRAIAAIRSFLREHVPGFKNLAMTDDELIRKFILPARRFIEGEGGAGTQAEGDAAFSQDRPVRTVQVDGVRYPDTNSKGQVIHSSFQGQVNFWRGFKGSAVVDSAGRPLVVYRGGATEDWRTGSAITEFRSANGPWAGFFTSSPETASRFAAAQYGMTLHGGAPAGVFPVYLAIKNPLEVDAKGKPARDFQIDASVVGQKDSPLREQLLSGKHDGLILRNTADEGDVFVPLHPEQVKSALGNSGQFDPAMPDILESRTAAEPPPPLEGHEVGMAPALATAMRRWQKGRLGERELAAAIAADLDARRAKREDAVARDRVRGPDWIRERLLRGRRTNELNPGMVDLALWMLEQAPHLANDLALSVRTSPTGELGAQGLYNAAARLVTLFTNAGSDETAVHEILHHTEQMMPRPVQDGIRVEWVRQLERAIKEARAKLQPARTKAPKAAGPMGWGAIDSSNENDDTRQTLLAMDAMLAAARAGDADLSMALWRGVKNVSPALSRHLPYALSTPSEFWAVNGARIIAERAHAAGGSWIDRAVQWLKELGQKARSLLGLNSDAPVLRGLQAVIEGNGARQSPMLANRQGEIHADETTPPIPTANQGAIFGEPGEWDMPEDSRTDRFIREMQDGRVDLRRVQQAITAAGREIDQRFDARQAETLYPGRVDRRTKAFLAVEARPLIDAMARAKASLTELSDYLIARHAPDRNALIAQRNPDLPDGGAGTNSAGELMTTQAARDYIAAIPTERRAQLEELARYVDGITKGTRELLVREGLEKRSTIEGWERALGSKYVPLFKEDREGGAAHPIGSGFSVRGGASKSATGSTAQVQNVLAHVLEQREAAITRAEKNRVAMRLYGLALSNPNREFWTTIKPGMTNEAIGRELTAMGVNIDDAVAGMQRTPTIRSLDPTTGVVVDRPNPVYKNLLGALSVRINGEDRVLLLNIENERAKRMAEALKNLDGLTRLDQATSIAASVGRAMADGTRWIASVNTQYNPVFGLRNIFRDVWGGIVNLGSTPLRGKSWQVLSKLPIAMAGIASSIARDEQSNGQWARLWEQFQNDGGRTGWRDSFKDPAERTKAIETELKALAHAGRLTPRALASRMLHLLDHFNVVLENSVRLAAYKTALDMGLSRDRAAVIGRELTVDFNRKGRLGRELNPIYAFFNASVQGAARHVETLNGPTGKYVFAGGILLGALQVLALAMGGYDDDELSDFDLSRAFIVPMGKDADGKKRHLKLPYPIGLNILPNTGRVLTQLLLNGGKNGMAQVAQAVGNIFEALSPLGGSDLIDKDGHATAHGALTLVSPTVFDPLVDLATNRNFAGAPIEREARNAQDNRPGFQRVREGTQRSATGEAYMGVAQVINRMTGGSPYEPGYVSPTPERLRYIAETIGGGVVRELEKVVDSTDRAVRGEPQKGTNLPAVSGFYGEVDNHQVQQSRYFDNSRAIDKTQASIKAATKAGDKAELEKLYARPEASMGPAQDRIQQRLTVLNKLAAATISDREKMREIDKAREQTMQQLNDAILAKERETPTLGDKLKKALAPAAP